MKIVKNNSTKLIMVNDEKFKSFRIVVSFHTPLGDEYATQNTLLFNVLKTSCAKYPSKESLSLALDGLYGAQLYDASQKTGGHLLPSLVLDMVSSKYSDSSQLKNAFDILCELLFKPDLENGTFKDGVVELERDKDQDRDDRTDDGIIHKNVQIAAIYYFCPAEIHKNQKCKDGRNVDQKDIQNDQKCDPDRFWVKMETFVFHNFTSKSSVGFLMKDFTTLFFSTRSADGKYHAELFCI